MVYYERDEARHVSLGIQYLPELLKQMSLRERMDFYAWQLRLFMYELDGVQEMQDDFRALGLSPREVVRMGQLKQYHACRLLESQVPGNIPAEEIFSRLIEMRLAWSFPEEDESIAKRLTKATSALIRDPEELKAFRKVLNTGSPKESFDRHEAA